ncbi:MAG: histidine phosphatase family protein [Nanoarchaeota archaeon]|nr:histidine phosphatase family protein [Nanoarchaeota archaeon]
MRLIMARHGETQENIDEIMQGQTPGHLTKKGIAQAKRLARRFRKEDFDIIYSSDLLRCKDTLKEIRKHHPKTRVRYAKELRERGFGVFEGRAHQEIDAHLKRHNIRFGTWKPKGGESGAQKTRRVKRFLERMLREHANDKVLWVTHGGVIYSVLHSILGIKVRKNNLETKNTAVSIVELDTEGNHQVHLVNCVKHL